MENADTSQAVSAPKDQWATLDNELKEALKKDEITIAKAVVEKMKAVDSQNKAVAKAEKSIEVALKKAKEKRIEEYERVFKMLFSSGEVEKIYQLAQELKAYDPGGKLADKWIERTDKFEAAMQQKEHGGEIDMLKAQIKTAFIEKKFDEAFQFIEQLSKFDPINHFGKNYIRKIEREQSRAASGAATDKMSQIKEMASDKIMDIKSWGLSLFTKAPSAIGSNVAALSAQDDADLRTLPSDASAKVDAQSQGGGEGDNIFEGVISPELRQKHQDEQGNIFTRMFVPDGDGKTPQSIIDVIVEKKAEEKNKEKSAGKTKVVEKRQEGFLILGFSKALLNFSIIFVIFSATFLYVNIVDKNNVALKMFNVEQNYAQKLHGSAVRIDELKKEKRELSEEIKRYQEGYNNNHEAVVKKIIDSRLNWPDVLAKINEVANSLYELNDFFQYIQFNNFSFDTGSRKISLSGSLRDPGKRNLTRMVDLEEAFKYYPAEKNVKSESIKPYFLDSNEFTSYSKSLDNNTGDYISRFSLSFKLNQ